MPILAIFRDQEPFFNKLLRREKQMNGAVLRILIADDDEGDRRQIKRALDQSGLRCECSETLSTEQALELCE